ncbi:heterokaryon incompatibility protein-domain-containing protein [Bisporella sp. PMI_857]|nr:heterokaryon incompatibility protein-domain-containing protein [Bisporella sp. PMI_857]
MHNELDKISNLNSGFKHTLIAASSEVRLLRVTYDQDTHAPCYDLEVIAIEDLPSTHYKALSYVWGHENTIHDVHEIGINGQPFYIRSNLFDFLTAAASKGESGLFFIDAICINQLNYQERAAQVQEMARVFRNANEVIAWLGNPDASHFDNVQTLSQIKNKDCYRWSAAQLKALRYISYNRYWTRIWIVQEVLVASSMSLWCGPSTLSIGLFTGISRITALPDAESVEVAKSVLSGVRSPAEMVITHRLRHVPRPYKDVLAQGTIIKTRDEMAIALRKPTTIIKPFQSQVGDLVYRLVTKFGTWACSDPRDRLYGLLGLLNEKSKAKIQPDYQKGKDFAFYQALKIGFEEIYADNYPVDYIESKRRASLGYWPYYCDSRSAFGMSDAEGARILRQVLGELRLGDHIRGAFEIYQMQDHAILDTKSSLISNLERLLDIAAIERHEEEGKGALFEYHERQREVAKKGVKRIRDRFRRFQIASQKNPF